MGEASVSNAYHIPIVRNELTKNINNLLPDVHDEITLCFPEIIPETDGKSCFTVITGRILIFDAYRMGLLHGDGENLADRRKD